MEAVQSEALKAFKGGVGYLDLRGRADAGELRLAPVGSAIGRVRASVADVKDLSGVLVYVPGTRYVAVTGSDGRFDLGSMPAGRFDLSAHHSQLGDGRLSRTHGPQPLRILPGEVTQLPDLTLEVHPPRLLRITRARTAELTDNGAPGTEIDLHGEDLGQTRGLRFQITFPGAGVAPNPRRLDDSLLRVRVPPGVAIGQIVVIVGELTSNGLPFRALSRFDMVCPADATLSVGQTLDLGALVDAFDTSGGLVSRTSPGPNLAWSADSDRLAVTAAGLVTAISEGQGTVSALAGDIASRSCPLTILARPVFTGPSPSPTPLPTPPPIQTSVLFEARNEGQIRGLVLDETSVFWVANPSTGSEIRRVPKAGGEPTVLLAGGAETGGYIELVSLAVDSSSVYALDLGAGQPGQARILGLRKPQGRPFTVAASISAGADLLIDGIHAYWIDPAAGQIRRVALNDGAQEKLADLQDQATDLAIDQENVYWVVDSRAIRKRKKSGGPVQDLVVGIQVCGPHSLVSAGGYLYYGCWDAGQGGGARRVRASGGSQEILVGGLDDPVFRLVGDGNEVFLGMGSRRIWRVREPARQLELLVDQLGSDVAGLAIDADRVFWAEGEGGTRLRIVSAPRTWP